MKQSESNNKSTVFTNNKPFCRAWQDSAEHPQTSSPLDNDHDHDHDQDHDHDHDH